MGKWIWCYVGVINLVSFLIYGLDKWKAKRDAWRIPETTLLVFALLGGSVGAFAGMQLFRHKTKHMKFVIGVPVIFLLQIAFVWFLFIK